MAGTNYGRPIEVFIDGHSVGFAYEVEIRAEQPEVARDYWGRPVVDRVHKSIHLNEYKEQR